MKPLNMMSGLAAVAAFAASGTCMAQAGMADGADPFAGYQSTTTRAAVMQEYLDARAQGLLPRGDVEYSMPEASRADIGARGPAGSRYQGRTRQEVIDELREYRRTHKPNDPKDIYFGG